VVRTADVTGSGQLMTSSVLHVRCGAEVRQYMIRVTRQGQWRLDDADISFLTLADLIAYYCEPSRCVLPLVEFSVIYLLRYRNNSNAAGNALGHACVSVCPVRAVTFESLDVETSFLVCIYIFRISTSNLYSKVIGSSSEAKSRKKETGVTKYTFAGGRPSIDRQTCYSLSDDNHIANSQYVSVDKIAT